MSEVVTPVWGEDPLQLVRYNGYPAAPCLASSSRRRGTASMVHGLRLQPGARLIEHFVGQHRVINRARQDHRPDHRRWRIWRACRPIVTFQYYCANVVRRGVLACQRAHLGERCRDLILVTLHNGAKSGGYAKRRGSGTVARATMPPGNTADHAIS